MRATRSYSSRVIVCLVALVESSTTYVDFALRLSTRVFTTTFPNSVLRAFDIFSVSSRSRSGAGFHSTDFAWTWYATITPSCRLAPASPLRIAEVYPDARLINRKDHPRTRSRKG